MGFLIHRKNDIEGFHIVWTGVLRIIDDLAGKDASLTVLCHVSETGFHKVRIKKAVTVSESDILSTGLRHSGITCGTRTAFLLDNKLEIQVKLLQPGGRKIGIIVTNNDFDLLHIIMLHLQ